MTTATMPANAIAPLYGPNGPFWKLGTNPMQPKSIRNAVPSSSAKNIDTSFCHGGRSNNWLDSFSVPAQRKPKQRWINKNLHTPVAIRIFVIIYYHIVTTHCILILRPTKARWYRHRPYIPFETVRWSATRTTGLSGSATDRTVRTTTSDKLRRTIEVRSMEPLLYANVRRHRRRQVRSGRQNQRILNLSWNAVRNNDGTRNDNCSTIVSIVIDFKPRK